MRNKTVPISKLGCLLNRSKNIHNNKHAVAGCATKIASFRKVLWFRIPGYLCNNKKI